MSRLAYLSFPPLLLLACDGGAIECTELGCESKMVVDYGEVSANGAYDLQISASGLDLSARCNDPGSMEEVDNPPELSCSTSGFEIIGPSVDTTSSVNVTVVRVEDEEVLIGNIPVNLTVAEIIEPNGPDCEPKCYERHGTVVF
jgi:hypothetical protein